VVRIEGMKIQIVLAVFALAFGGSVQAQIGSVADPGTYQLYTVEPKIPEVFTTDLRVFIEYHREQSHDVVIRIGQVTWVKILARTTITDPAFVPLPEDILPVAPGTMPDIPVER
jgi:hypothetical protein